MKNLVYGFSLLALLSVFACGGGGRRSGGGGGGGSKILAQVLFETRAEIAVGDPKKAPENVIDAVLVDLNGDGNQDLAVTTLTKLGGNLHILLGSGKGTFSPGLEKTLPGTPLMVKAADFDRDGDKDLAVLQPEKAKISVLINDGAANFSFSPEIEVGSYAINMAVGDGNGDATPDLTVIHQKTDSKIHQYLGRGDGQFKPGTPLELPKGTEPFGLVFGDVTGEGLLDIILTDLANARLIILEAKKGGGYDSPRTVACGKAPVAVEIGDLNGDKRDDLVVSNLGDGNMTLLKAKAGGGFDASTISSEGAPTNTLIADVTGDGFTDLIACAGGRASISIFSGKLGGTLDKELQMSASGLPGRPLVGDVNKDNEPDLLVTGFGLGKISLYLGRGGMLSGSFNYLSGIDTPRVVASADFDGDGEAEMAVAGSDLVRKVYSTKVSILAMFENKAMNTRAVRPVKTIDVKENCVSIEKGDFNGDGKIDLAVSTDKGVKVLGNSSTKGNLQFTVHPAYLSTTKGELIFGISARDMNGDGLTDIIMTDPYVEEVVILLAKGNFSYSAPLRTSVTKLPGGLAVEDFTGDGIPDVAVSRNSGASISVLENDGRGQLKEWTVVLAGLQPNYMRSADFDRDGRMDLVVSNGYSDSITVWLARAKGFAEFDLPAGKAPTALLTRDLNRDGNPDILVASLTGADFRVLLGDGKGGFPTQMPFPGTFRAISADLADLNGDQLMDLVVASLDTARISVYRNISK